MDAFFTLTVQVSLVLPIVAVIFAVPAFFAVTLPVLLTVATFLLLDFHFGVRVVPFTFSVYVLPVFTLILVFKKDISQRENYLKV